MPAGVGGASVTPGTGITDAACPQPASTSTAVSPMPSSLRIVITGTR